MFRIFLLLAGLALLAAHPAKAAALCGQDNPTLEPLPGPLVPQVEKLFGLQAADAAWVERTTVIRCMGGRIWACNYGANLPCGKAATADTLPAGDDWCRQYPDSDFIPAYITGHDSIWRWRCVKGAPTPIGPPAEVDAQGYLARYWKPLD